MLNVLDYIDDDYIKTYHLPPDREITVTVTDARVEQLPKRDKLPASQRVSLGIKGSKRRLLLNKTNARTLLALGWSRDATTWAGAKLVLKVGRFPRDPSKEDRVVIVARHADAQKDDGHAIRDDAPPPEASKDDATLHVGAAQGDMP